MTLTLHAQPYDITAAGFYFDTYEEYSEKAAKLRNDYGAPVEEFEIQFIDGEHIDCDLAKAVGVNQANLAQYFTAVEDWEEFDKITVVIAVGECGYAFDVETQPGDFDVVVHYAQGFTELAEQFVDEGMFGDIPERLQFYIDYEAIGRDLSIEYTQTEIAGQSLIYQCL